MEKDIPESFKTPQEQYEDAKADNQVFGAQKPTPPDVLPDPNSQNEPPMSDQEFKDALKKSAERQGTVCPTAVNGAGKPVSPDELKPTGETKTEPSTKKGNKAGTSSQEGYKDSEGRDVTKHTVTDSKGNVIHQHYRPGPFK